MAKTLDTLPPKVELRRDDAQGSIIAPDGSAGGTVYVSATDPTSDQQPVASGIYAVELKNLDTGAAISPPSEIAAQGENPYTRTFSNLPEGRYELHVWDGLAQDTSVNLTTSPGNSSTRAA